MTQRDRYKISKKLLLISTVAATVAAIIMVINGFFWLGIILVIFGYVDLKFYEKIKDIEDQLKPMLMIESFLDKLIKASDNGDKDFKVDRELDKFINETDPVVFEKMVNEFTKED